MNKIITEEILLKDRYIFKNVSSLPILYPELEKYAFSEVKWCFSVVQNYNEIQLVLPKTKYLLEYLEMLQNHFFVNVTIEDYNENFNYNFYQFSQEEEVNKFDKLKVTIQNTQNLKTYYDFVMIRKFFTVMYFEIVDKMLHFYINNKNVLSNDIITKNLWWMMTTGYSEMNNSDLRNSFNYYENLVDFDNNSYKPGYFYYFGIYQFHSTLHDNKKSKFTLDDFDNIETFVKNIAKTDITATLNKYFEELIIEPKLKVDYVKLSHNILKGNSNFKKAFVSFLKNNNTKKSQITRDVLPYFINNIDAVSVYKFEKSWCNKKFVIDYFIHGVSKKRTLLYIPL